MPLRPSRAFCCKSPAVSEPLVVAGGTTQLFRVKGSETDPPSGDATISVKLICVPQTKAGEVLTEKATCVMPFTFSFIVGNVVLGWVIVTFGVLVESIAVTLDAMRQPIFCIVTFKSLHSFDSMVPSQSPPVTDDEM